MVYAKTQQAAAKLSEQVRNNKMTKEYLAVLTGTLPKKEGRLEDMLLSNGKTNRTEVVEGKIAGAKKAVLEYKVKRTKFEEGQQYSLVNVHLITGRRHQIRVQMAHAGAGLWEIQGIIQYLRIKKAGLIWHFLPGIWNSTIR